MNTMKNKRGAAVLNIYNPAWYLKAIWMLVAGLMLLVHLPLLSEIRNSPADSSGFPFIFLILILIDGFLLWYGIIYCTQTRIIVYEDGLELQRGGAAFFSPWENMSHFGRRGSGKNAHYGIYLYDSLQPEVNGLVEKLLYGRASDFMSVGQVLHLPTRWIGIFEGSTVDTDKLLNTDFGREIYQFAPQLFGESEEKAKHG